MNNDIIIQEILKNIKDIKELQDKIENKLDVLIKIIENNYFNISIVEELEDINANDSNSSENDSIKENIEAELLSSFSDSEIKEFDTEKIDKYIEKYLKKYHEGISKKRKNGRAEKASKGGYSGGRAPFGYKVENGCLIINEDEKAVVLRIFELRKKGVSHRSIAEIINSEGYHGRKGGPVAFGTIRNILDNKKTYQGYYRYGGSDWVKGTHEAILPIFPENEIVDGIDEE